MSIFAAIGMFVMVAIAIFAGTMVGGTMRFGRFGSSGVAILGTGGSFALSLTLAVACGGNALTWVFAGLAALIFGVMMRGTASN